MKISLKKFRKDFLDRILELHWRHWTALGLAGTVEPEKCWLIDLEPLIVSTFTIGLNDKRLLNGALEWLKNNAFWINLSRLRRIGEKFGVKIPNSDEELLAPKTTLLLIEVLKSINRKKTFTKFRTHNSESNSYEKIIKGFRSRGISMAPKPKLYSSLLQLSLRGIFGIDTRVEVFIYLLFYEYGNSNSIAQETFHNQRNVYKILDILAKTGMVERYQKKKIKNYALKNKKYWLKILGVRRPPKYLNWARTFLVLDMILKEALIPHYNNEYLLSSLFRDIINEIKFIGQSLNIDIPDPDSYPGDKYFNPFVNILFNIIDRLISDVKTPDWV